MLAWKGRKCAAALHSEFRVHYRVPGHSENPSFAESTPKSCPLEGLYSAGLLSTRQLDEIEQLLQEEPDRRARSADPHAMPDETRAFLAITLLARGKPVEAAALALTALAPHLSRYTRSVRAITAGLAAHGDLD